jgi:hypothetical protein
MKALLKITQACMLICLLSIIACKESMVPEPVKKGAKPDAVSQYTTEAIPGGAVITYQVPAGTDLRYVKATYTLNTGVVREAKSTIYKNTLLVEGFSKAGDYNITLTAVGVGEVESEPITVKITALRPVHELIIDSIRVNNRMYTTFGGINVDYQNETESNLVIRVMIKESGTWVVSQTEYTKAKSGRIRLRGFPPLEREFAVYVTDRWNNKSDTLIRSLTPLYETEFSKALFKEYRLPSDSYLHHTGSSRARALPVIWDGIKTKGNMFQSANGGVVPQHFTWDMGVTAKLSRFVFYPDANSTAVTYGNTQPKVWELWGSNSPNSDGSFASWTLVGTFNATKPSGLPPGQINDEDVKLAQSGEEFEVDPEAKGYRYWRWRTLETWGGASSIVISEFSFFGTPEN